MPPQKDPVDAQPCRDQDDIVALAEALVETHGAAASQAAQQQISGSRGPSRTVWIRIWEQITGDPYPGDENPAGDTPAGGS